MALRNYINICIQCVLTSGSCFKLISKESLFSCFISKYSPGLVEENTVKRKKKKVKSMKSFAGIFKTSGMPK